MGLFNILDPVLDTIFSPVLKLPSVVGIFILSILITLLITVIYKYTTDQVLLKEIRGKQKKLQEEMKKNKDNPKKVMALQKEAMGSSMEMMKQSFRSMLYTFVPIIIIFGWLATHYAYLPLQAGDEFNVTLAIKKGATGDIAINVPSGIEILSQPTIGIEGKTESFTLRAADAGKHTITFTHGNDFLEKEVVVGGSDGYIKQLKAKKTFIDYIYGSREGYLSAGDIFQIKVDYEKVRPFGTFSFFGWRPGWLGTYILFSIALSIFIRKVLKVH